MLTSSDIRAQFLDFFKGRGHTAVPSSMLVPHHDPTLLFTNAGMVQFKSVFLGDEQRPYSRAVSAQKCMRAGGKHNDLENVGRTARHHTFFEMLGNFSFGDYFKAEAIALAWEFMTQALHIPAAGLWVTVYKQDEEAYRIWQKTPGVSSDRIVRMGERDNFWSMGDTGPCGPCSEILIDQGPQSGCGRPDCAVGCSCDRFLELWNLVFMQYNRDDQGCMTPLPRPSIDTGMGLERVTAVKQGVGSNYDTDLFRPLIGFVEQLSGMRYRHDPGQDTSMRIIADHCRAVAFLVADGVLPANEGRGYVLRRIMRRAARHGRLLGLTEPFLHTAVRVVAEQMQDVYPEVLRSFDYVSKVVLNEEQSFAATLEAGLGLLEAEMAKVQAAGGTQLPGDVAFRLYDTYGFPMDLTVDIAAEKRLTVDQAGFDRAMLAQKTRARQAWRGSGDEQIEEAYRKMSQAGLRVAFSGYERPEAEACIQKIVCGGREVLAAAEGDSIEVVAVATPFYGESGGQVGDAGTIAGQHFSIEVSDTLKPLPELIVHKGRVARGQVRTGDAAVFRVDPERRQATANNHTATHILHAVLRAHLGTHVKQAGSLVSPERLRFDFTHFEALTQDDIKAIEAMVNARIRQNTALGVRVLPQQEALAMGATALFGEKYGDQVRVVSIGDYSMELCGGTHTRTTGELGFFKILSEGAVAAGVRRIEAVTGAQAFQLMQQQAETIAQLAAMLKAEPGNVIEKVERLLAHQKAIERELAKLKGQLISRQAASILDDVREIGGVQVLAARIEGQDPKELRAYGDKIRDRLGSGILVFGAAADGKAQLLCMVTREHCGRFSAGRIIQQIAPIVGGRGGGRDDMAQAGGKDAEKIDEALARALAVIAEMSAGT